MNKKAVSLLSGGLDSTTVLYYAIDQGYDITAFTFDYGQRHSREIEASKLIAEKAGVKQKLFKIDLRQIGGSALTSNIDVPDHSDDGSIPVTYVPGRNIIFLSIAASFAETIGSNNLFIGANAIDYSGYPDCRPEFYASMIGALSSGTKIGNEKGFDIKVPLQNLSKSEIVRLAVKLQAPIELTTSCYRGGKKACGKCDSCHIRLKGFVEAGIPDRIDYEYYPDFYKKFMEK